ncbi:3-phenylpropionate/trans-cinnamate dioxygenase ferredoxin reductase subunit [Sphingomonas vulcanisoli]|uniref:3-phenylpropionate/trans-cinnamate dioxygenase ferredoxin reductase subunit n=1 Tax=Sphingomonas vulcanisoli TaxID=1658060 RepID=A0ABX0TY22_9SPHN|nr:FAD-dependent oxidoreductase [Sphingomonas vulcanisoli]NIJ09285.1 3-phenylpropionate/trans-cinnamate dioxygenase ferredoxin reductase subunit [Sphingomonas vulcanisoli]
MTAMLIIGAGEAGIAAAGALREAGHVGRVLVVGEEPHHPYARPPLSKAVLTEDACPVEHIRSAEWLEERGIELWLGACVESVDAAAHSAEIVRGAERCVVPYDKLLIATGAAPRHLPSLDPLGGLVTYLRNWEEAIALRSRLARAQSVVIVGGGVIGLEVASSAIKLGCTVTVIEPAPRLMARALAAGTSEMLLDLHRTAGVYVRLGVGLASAKLVDGYAELTLDDGDRIDADLVVAAIGVVPNDLLASRLGCAVDQGILVDANCATSVADVFAAGDVARLVHPLADEPIRVEAWQHARRHGAHAARAMLGDTSPYAEIPWFWTDQHGVNIQVAGLPGLADSHVERGATTLHLQGDRLIAATTIDNGRDIRPATKMIAAGWSGPVAALTDPSIPLARLAQAPIPA